MGKKNYVQVSGAEFWIPISQKELRRLKKYLRQERLQVLDEDEDSIYWHVESAPN